MPRHRRVERGVAAAGLSGFGEGDWWVQDISASMPARLLGKGEARTAPALWAGPGGNTCHPAAAGSVVTPAHAPESRLPLLCGGSEAGWRRKGGGSRVSVGGFPSL